MCLIHVREAFIAERATPSQATVQLKKSMTTLAKITPQTISECLKSQIFPGGHAPDPPSLELPMAAYKFSPPKVKLLPTPMYITHTCKS